MSRVDEAFTNIGRAQFLPEESRHYAYIDTPVSIGYGQTNSQPSLVRQMIEWLDVRPGDKVLDVGSGSGWTTALLSYIVGPKGKVYAVEKVPELVEFGRENCKKTKITNVEFFQAGDEFGLPEHAPFDRILVSAAANEVPRSLLEQLKPGGKMVIPVGSDIETVTKTDSGELLSETKHGFVFVPLVQ